MPEKAFFVVWNPGHGAPTVRHDTFQEAEIEAARIAELQPHQEVFVLRAVSGVKRLNEPYVRRTFRK